LQVMLDCRPIWIGRPNAGLNPVIDLAQADAIAADETFPRAVWSWIPTKRLSGRQGGSEIVVFGGEQSDAFVAACYFRRMVQ
jgi:hypothetical protein